MIAGKADHTPVFLAQTLASWQSSRTRWYSREFSESGIRAVQCYDCPTAQCGSGHHMEVPRVCPGALPAEGGRQVDGQPEPVGHGESGAAWLAAPAVPSLGISAMCPWGWLTGPRPCRFSSAPGGMGGFEWTCPRVCHSFGLSSELLCEIRDVACLDLDASGVRSHCLPSANVNGPFLPF